MTDTNTPEAPAKQPWLVRLRNLLHHPAEDHTKSVVSELLDKVHELEHRLAALEAAAMKDAPVGAHAAEDAATVVADVEKAAGAP